MLRPNLKFLLRPPGEKSRWEYVFYLMRFRLFSRSRPGSGNALSLAITALETLNAVSDLIPAGPLFGPIVSSVLGLAKTLEKLSGSKEQCAQLGERAAGLMKHIKKHLDTNSGPISDELKANLEELSKLIASIRSDVEQQLKRSFFYRFTHQSSMTSEITKHIQEFDDAWHSFDSACLVSLDKKAEEQKGRLVALQTKIDREATIDDKLPLRLLHWFHIQGATKRGTCRILDKYDVDEYQARLDGRAVLVRRFRERPRPSFDYDSLIVYNPDKQEPHPNLGQVLARSHPSVEKPFYVLESGSTPLMHDFKGVDAINFVQNWLKHYICFLSAFKFGDQYGIPIWDGKHMDRFHNHNEGCLPSASLNDNGQLVIDATDLCRSMSGCFNGCLSGMYNKHVRSASHQPVPEILHALPASLDPAENLLAALNLDVEVRKTRVEAFIQSEFGYMWPVAKFTNPVHANVGEYGYVVCDSAGEHFVRLGHLDDIIEGFSKTILTILRTLSRHTVTPWKFLPQWPDHAVSYEFNLDPQGADSDDRMTEARMSRQVPILQIRKFFWYHAEDIARKNGVAMHDLVLIYSQSYFARAELLSSANASSNTPPRVYYKQQAATAEGGVPFPWGFWSLNPDEGETTPPSPPLSVSGVDLSDTAMTYYAYLPPFTAEVMVALNHLCVEEKPSVEDSSRFEVVS